MDEELEQIESEVEQRIQSLEKNPVVRYGMGAEVAEMVRAIFRYQRALARKIEQGDNEDE